MKNARKTEVANRILDRMDFHKEAPIRARYLKNLLRLPEEVLRALEIEINRYRPSVD